MSIENKQTPPEQAVETPDEIRALFDRCVQKERDRLRGGTNNVEPTVQLIFAENAGPKFTTPPYNGDSLLWKSLYLDFVEELKTASDMRLWYLLGVWLKDEGIRNPETFFPRKILKELTKEFGISQADLRNVNALRLWLPYTEPLVRKARWLRKQEVKPDALNARLEQLGYDDGAVSLSATKPWRSPVEFTSEWVASRTLSSDNEYQRETLVNSYSRYFKEWRPLCFLCWERAVGEFWVCEKPIAHCQVHSPDKLPESENDAWLDRAGRRWWRQEFEIRYTMPAV
jgi:hypothetical protein